MNNLLSYCGLVDMRINASDKDLPVQPMSALMGYIMRMKILLELLVIVSRINATHHLFYTISIASFY